MWCRAAWPRCRPLPMCCSCTTAATCWKRHGLPQPRTWDELGRVAQASAAGPRATRSLQGLSLQGAPVEGRGLHLSAALLEPGQGGAGRALAARSSTPPAAARGLHQWLDADGRRASSSAMWPRSRRPTPSTNSRPARCCSRLNWSWAWDRFEKDADSQVQGQGRRDAAARHDRGPRAPPAPAAGSGR